MNLNGRQVLARMRRGDLPTLKGGYTARSVFADGAVASHKVDPRRTVGCERPLLADRTGGRDEMSDHGERQTLTDEAIERMVRYVLRREREERIAKLERGIDAGDYSGADVQWLIDELRAEIYKGSRQVDTIESLVAERDQLKKEKTAG